MKNALILGGTRGIGQALYDLIYLNDNWHPVALGRSHYDILSPSNQAVYDLKHTALDLGGYDAFIYCAGDLCVTGLDAFRFPNEFYNIVTGFGPLIFKDQCRIIAVSSVAAGLPCRNNPDYGAAKSALEHYVMSLREWPVAKRKDWNINFWRFDLVMTDMMKFVPADQRAGRRIISPQEAAKELYDLL